MPGDIFPRTIDFFFLFEFQTLLKVKVGVCAHETLEKVLTESVSLLQVDPTLDPPVMFTCRSRTGQEHDLEGQLQQVRPGIQEGFHADMYIS